MPSAIVAKHHSGRDGRRRKSPEPRRLDDSRAEPRYRAHLRGGMIADLDRRVIAYCLICDRSARGARLRLQTGSSVPNEILFYDDETDRTVRAKVRWRRDQEIGIYIPG